jgi:hypothetical protein
MIVSPVLKSTLVITLDSSFAGVLDPEDLEVFIEEASNITNIRALNVMSVDNTAKTLSCKYGGAYSGLYKVIVRSISLGRFDADDVELLVQTKITDFTPKSGSRYGGTLITIYGDNFSEDKLDNNVRIGLYTDCLV